ncbi:hypothetical protein HD596_008389 [Nonomuraea jabiensis]|uniref:Uncharacterized protein n=1 Tax=Nonomuraea jabiensis TaxID=882448 RepID=A0A7W9LFC7_9ACTN|nr:hypothetical protein [Nonomuraea jabiensis]
MFGAEDTFADGRQGGELLTGTDRVSCPLAPKYGHQPVPLQSYRRALELRIDLMRRYRQDQFLCLSLSCI